MLCRWLPFKLNYVRVWTMEGLSLAIQRTELPVAIEMDSLIAVKMIQAKEVDRSIYASLIKEIRYLMSIRES